MRDYDKEYAIKQMQNILRAREDLLRLKQRTITELADFLGVKTNSLYKLYKSRMGITWKEAMPIEILIRNTSGLERYLDAKKNI